MSTDLHPWRSLRKVVFAGALLALTAFGLHAAPVSHAAAAVSIPPTTATPASSDPDYHYTVQIPNCIQPPNQSKVDHATLTDAQLQTYGLPTRAQFKGDTPRFTALVRKLNNRACTDTVYPNKTLSDFASASSQLAKEVAKTRTAQNEDPMIPATYWAGYLTYAPTNDSWDGAEAFFNVADILSQTYRQTSADWTGIGGWQNINLVQSGIINEVNVLLQPEHYAVVDNVGNVVGSQNYNSTYGNGTNSLFNVNVGDAIYASDFNSCNGSDCTGFMSVDDESTETYGELEYGPGGATNTFECIHERTQGALESHELTKTTKVTYQQCDGQDHNNLDQNGGPGDNSYEYFGLCMVSEDNGNNGKCNTKDTGLDYLFNNPPTWGQTNILGDYIWTSTFAGKWYGGDDGEGD